jgi:hypothetical protein
MGKYTIGQWDHMRPVCDADFLCYERKRIVCIIMLIIVSKTSNRSISSKKDITKEENSDKV